MTQEEKDLLLKDLCARLPYFGLMVQYKGEDFNIIDIGFGRVTLVKPFMSFTSGSPLIEEIKPYLRPISSMTEEEKRHISKMMCLRTYDNGVVHDMAYPVYTPYYVMEDCLSYLRSIHMDYSGMIEKGLALTAPEGMYK